MREHTVNTRIEISWHKMYEKSMKTTKLSNININSVGEQ